MIVYQVEALYWVIIGILPPIVAPSKLLCFIETKLQLCQTTKKQGILPRVGHLFSWFEDSQRYQKLIYRVQYLYTQVSSQKKLWVITQSSPWLS